MVDLWKFFDITHREHVLWNPMSVEKFEELIALLRLGPGDRVLEIATGKGEFIIRLAEQYDIEGIGVDLSPYCVSGAKEKHQQRIPDAQLSFVEMDGADYEPEDRAIGETLAGARSSPIGARDGIEQGVGSSLARRRLRLSAQWSGTRSLRARLRCAPPPVALRSLRLLRTLGGPLISRPVRLART